ncbi:hypothetical protein Pcinc_011294 [Petrolisthes cinctipes]|uniref:Uncharacterized protein n=1 Tax=Petrolisthes cinctipes TaxID=88211 RepID=A0AAE1G1A6_PETCI|nr:hypothetical protein Pcinc_011294 [Petrolisthes cinctipes]
MLGEENSDLGEEGVLTAGQPPREVEEETGDQPNEDWMRLRDENQRSLVDMLSELIQEMGAVNNRMIRIEMRQGVADSEHLQRGVLSRIHGGWGVGGRNEEGEGILDFCLASDMAITNTFFKRTPDQYITYKSGIRETQVDFLLCRRNHLGEVKSCKVIKGEGVTAQHRLVVLDCVIKGVKRGRKQGTPKIKWWELKNERLKQQFKERVLNEITPKENANEWWEENSNIIRRVGEELLGKTSGRGAPQDKESWWWNREVQEKIRLKKEAKKKWDLSGRDDDKVAAKAAKKEAKKAVAQAKARRKMRTLTTKMIKGP